ncbi:vancomycin high temperature exclusion protein [Catenulispora pinistramenti]|uniref:SanA/YdcF family protein n=1 Tax=Catenulispora pinistramenti TaxID=2705254 RepID=UPI002E76CCE6|nr:ElyC/SanA/YdcF family protein [Catenulispora pinistramenti]
MTRFQVPGWLSRRVPRTRKSQRRLYQAAALAVVLLFAPVSAVHATESSYERSAAAVPYEPVAIVFGAGAPNGQPTAYLARRLDVALDLYHRGKVSVILVTGDNSHPDYDEPTVMRDYLVNHGVPTARIVRDFAGFDTWASCARAKKIFGVDHATLVTQDFHMPRALLLCHAAGIDAYGVADTGESVDGQNELMHDSAREVLAGIKAWGQAVLQPNPVLGKKETSVTTALAAAKR